MPARLFRRLVACALSFPSLTIVAQTPTQSGLPTTAARAGKPHHVDAAPKIAGRLNDPEEKDAEPFTGFIQREMREGEPVTERTEVRVLSDGEALYIGAWLFDRDPQHIVAGEKIRDVSLLSMDSFAIILDTYLDRQNGFVFATTPAGVEYDGQVAKEGEGGGISVTGQTRAQSGSMGGFNLNWDGSWTVATSIDEAGWYAEFRIPFSTLRYGKGGAQTWGINFSRTIRRKNEEAFWSFVPRQFNLYRLSRAGTLNEIRVPEQRLATVTPYVLGSAQRDFAVDRGARRTTEFGADAKYGLTPSLTLDLTYNTDFAQVEVDEQRTNLTRFSLFFPEKRPFFLENAGMFSAGTPQLVDLFFTRRIGIDPVGNPVPIRAGGRVTGKAGDFTIGALEIVTDELAGKQPSNSYSVVRVQRELSARSRIGALAVHRVAVDSTNNRNSTFALDGRVGVGEAWTLDWWGAKTATPNRTGDDLGYSVRGGYTNANYIHSIRFVQVGPDLNPEVGFLNRTGGYRLYDVSFQRLVRRDDWPWFKQWNPHAGFMGYYGLDGFYQSGRVHVDMTEVELASGTRIGPELNIMHEGLNAPFEISPGVVLPKGSYDFATPGFDWTFDPSAPFSFVLRADVGPFYNGTRNGGSITATYRRGASLSTSMLFDYNDVKLDQGNFTRRLIGTRVGYFFTPRVFAQSLVQYNNQARVWTANARFGWLGTAGTGLFVVINDGEEANGYFRWGRTQARSVAVKFTRQVNF